MLKDEQITRYSRHILLPEIGGKGQQRLLDARVRIHGTGRAADEAATYLIAAGIGVVILDATLIETRGQHFRAMNPDVEVTSDSEAAFDLEIGKNCPKDTRLAGATAAFAAVVELGVQPSHGATIIEGFARAGIEAPWAD